MSFFKKFLAAISVALFAAVGAWMLGMNYAESLPKLYRSSATFSTSKSADARKDLRGFSQTQQEDLEMRLLSQQLLSAQVLESVSQSPAELRTLRQNILVEPVEETRLIRVKMDSRIPERAAELANLVVESFSRFKKQEAEQLYRDALNELEQEHASNQQNYVKSVAQLEAISKENLAARARQSDVVNMHQGLVASTQQRLNVLKLEQERGSVVRLVDVAVPASTPAYPNTTLIAAFSAAGGSLAGFGLTVLFFVLRRKKESV